MLYRDTYRIVTRVSRYVSHRDFRYRAAPSRRCWRDCRCDLPSVLTVDSSSCSDRPVTGIKIRRQINQWFTDDVPVESQWPRCTRVNACSCSVQLPFLSRRCAIVSYRRWNLACISLSSWSLFLSEWFICGVSQRCYGLSSLGWAIFKLKSFYLSLLLYYPVELN